MKRVASVGAVLAVGWAVACGGKVAGTEPAGGLSTRAPLDAGGGGGGQGGGGGGAMGGGGVGGGGSGGGGVSDAGEACFDVSVQGLSVACQVDTDCTVVFAGEVCVGAKSCECPGTVISASAMSAYEQNNAAAFAATGGGGECPCPLAGFAQCVQNTCTLCAPGKIARPRG